MPNAEHRMTHLMKEGQSLPCIVPQLQGGPFYNWSISIIQFYSLSLVMLKILNYILDQFADTKHIFNAKLFKGTRDLYPFFCF